MTNELLDVGIQPLGYRLPDEATIGRVRLQVSDLDTSLAYYTRVLGFRVRSRQGTLAQLAPQDGPVLVELHERPGARPVPRRGLLGLYHFAILLPERAALGRFVAHLGEVGAHAGSADHLVSEALYLSDPDGLGIEVYADRPRGQWVRHGREIAMTTEPLDLRALVRASGGEPWAGPAAGTDDARLLEWELRLPAAKDLAAAATSAARAGCDVRIENADRLMTDPWGTTVRLTQRSNS